MADPWTIVSGPFFRSIVAEHAHMLLEPPRPVDCGRYHCPGQAALYMTPRSGWARLVANWYFERDARPRVLFALRVSKARVLDLANEQACRMLGVDSEKANCSWREALAAGQMPSSWSVADAVRNAGGDGLIDRSRLFPGAWHVTLFAWNQPGKPKVTRVGEAEMLHMCSGPT